MNNIKNLMINKYKVNEYGLDFMGYRVTNPNDLSFHHLIIKKKDGGKEIIKNGALLLKESHRYLHYIEKKDKETFDKVTNELILENKKGIINLENLVNIDKFLYEFELKEKNHKIIKNLPKRFLRLIDVDLLNDIDKYEIKKNLHK